MAGLAAVYLAAIVSAQALADENRTKGRLYAVIFLRTNGFDVSVAEVDAYQIVSGVAAGGVDSSAVAAILRQNISPSE